MLITYINFLLPPPPKHNFRKSIWNMHIELHPKENVKKQA